MTEEARNEMIQAYLEGNMSEKERVEFETAMDQDPDLKAEVSDLRLIEKDLNAHRIGEFQTQLTSWEDEYKQALETPPSGFQLRRYLSIAATLTILAVAAIYFMKPAGTDEIYDTYYSPYADVLSTRGEAESQLLSEGMASYNAENYAVAAEKLGQFVESTSDPLAFLYLGISYLELDQPALAVDMLQRAENVSYTAHQAKWYLGLSFLKLDNIEVAKSYFTWISENSNHYKSTQASEILSRLN